MYVIFNLFYNITSVVTFLENVPKINFECVTVRKLSGA